MTSIVAAATAAIVAALQATPAVAAQVDRVRTRPVAQYTTLVVVRPDSADMQQPLLSMGAPAFWETSFVIECYAKSTTLALDAAVDEVVTAVYDRLMSDPTLGGAIRYLKPSPNNALEYEFDAEGDAVACARWSFRVAHVATTPITFSS